MSNMLPSNEWFWHNYNMCFQWQERHKYSYWKSKALALEYERDALLDHIRSVYANNKFEANYSRRDMNRSPRRTNVYGSVQLSSQTFEGNSLFKRPNGNRNKAKRSSRTSRENPSHHRFKQAADSENGFLNPEPEENDTTSPESQLDQDLLEFFKQSMKHKIELKQKRKASEESDSTDSLALNQELLSAKRSEEMRLLYGKKAPMIQGMETAMQLTFERNCDKLNPVLWPVLPLRM